MLWQHGMTLVKDSVSTQWHNIAEQGSALRCKISHKQINAAAQANAGLPEYEMDPHLKGVRPVTALNIVGMGKIEGAFLCSPMRAIWTLMITP